VTAAGIRVGRRPQWRRCHGRRLPVPQEPLHM